MYMMVTISFAYFLSSRFLKTVKDIFIYTLPLRLLLWILAIFVYIIASIFIKD